MVRLSLGSGYGRMRYAPPYCCRQMTMLGG
jgi:hypothetical protein